MCFFSFLWAGELVVPSDSSFDPSVHLAQGDVWVYSVTCPQYLEVTIKASKMNPFRRGVSIYLGATSATLCPVAAILDYMVQRGQSPGPFSFANGNSLIQDRFVSAVRSALQQAGVDPSCYARPQF